MNQREEYWKKRLEKESDKRKKLEEMVTNGKLYNNTCQASTTSSSSPKTALSHLGPDYEEGPHSEIREEEFFDALDAILDKHDQQQEEKRQLKIRAKEIGYPSESLPETIDHPLWPQVDKITLEQLYYARLEVGQEDNAKGEPGWVIFAEEGELRLYRRELEIEGLVCDPLKAVHTVKGVTAHEMCYHFFSPDVRWDWENTLESMKVVEEVNPNTLVFHQIHKRVWPAAQRDTVFWSHIRKINDLSSLDCRKGDENSQPNNDYPDLELHDIWTVCNKSSQLHDSRIPVCHHRFIS